MADRSPIEWTDATWNPIGGCTRVDEGCRNCYAEVMAARFSGPGQWGEGLAKIVRAGGKADHRWTGQMRLNEAALDRPIGWRKPRRIFVNSTSDLFHEAVPDEWIDSVFAVMALCPRHTFQVLTKRPERARQYLSHPNRQCAIEAAAQTWHGEEAECRVANWINGWSRPKETPGDTNPADGSLRRWPLPNVWLGTSIGDQRRADTRIPQLLACPAAARFISAEPLLGPVDITKWMHDSTRNEWPGTCICSDPREGRLDWVIVGGESGPGARPMHPDWARSLRDQCLAAGAPFFFKQWGEWEAAVDREKDDPDWRADYTNLFPDRGDTKWLNLAGGCGFHGDRFHVMHRIGKKTAGRQLDGQTWDQMPGVTQPTTTSGEA